MSKVRQIRILCFVLAALFFNTLSHAHSEEDSIKESIQILRDLCTLSVYIDGQFNYMVPSKNVIENLLDKNGTISKKKYNLSSFLDRVSVLQDVYMGEKFLEAIGTVFGKLVSTVKNKAPNLQVCTLSRMTTEQWIKENLEAPSYREAYIKLRTKHSLIKNESKADVQSQVNEAVQSYLSNTYQYKKKYVHTFSLKGSGLLDGFLEFGYSNFEDQELTFLTANLINLNLEEVFSTLQKVEPVVKNPLHWDQAYYLGVTYPTSFAYREFYVEPLSEISELYFTAIEKIEEGSFQEWWQDVFLVRE